MTCWECGASGPIHEHHVVPRSRGGTRTVPLCEACHGKAHHRHGNMTTSELTRAALAKRKARGDLVCGCAPIGTSATPDGRLVENDAEAAAVATILKLRSAGLSIRAIVDRLHADNIPARGGRWHATTVARVLARRQEGVSA